MRSLVFVFCCFISAFCIAQPRKTDLYTLIKGLMYDSTGYENVGNWAVGKPSTYPVIWKADRIGMSDDTSINFFRSGTAIVSIPQEVSVLSGPWNVMLKGARSGYTSFSLLSRPVANLPTDITLEALFGKKDFHADLLKSCRNDFSGFHYYKLKIPEKDLEYLKVSWVTVNGKTVVRLDGYDGWSKYAAKLDCLQ